MTFTTKPASEVPELLSDFDALLKEERDLVFKASPLEVSLNYLEEAQIIWTHVFYENGLAINVLYELNNLKKRAVGLKLSDGMVIPEELEGCFKFARQKSKLAGTIRGSYFTIKSDQEARIKQWLNLV